MGLFRFYCQTCKDDWSCIIRGDKVSLCPKCGVQGTRVYTPPNNPVMYEIRDTYRGIKIRQDLMRQVTKRSHEHTLNHCVDDIIASHGIDAAKKAGYLNEKGSKKTVFDEK